MRSRRGVAQPVGRRWSGAGREWRFITRNLVCGQGTPAFDDILRFGTKMHPWRMEKNTPRVGVIFSEANPPPRNQTISQTPTLPVPPHNPPPPPPRCTRPRTLPIARSLLTVQTPTGAYDNIRGRHR